MATDPLASIKSACASRPFVVAQLGQSLDGRIATLSGESRWINGEAALDHLHALRAAVDAVVVGVGTAIADDPRLNVRRCPLPPGKPQPARVVIDPRRRLPAGMRCLDPGDGASCIRISIEDGPEGTGHAHAMDEIHLPAVDGRLAPADIVSALAQRGLRKILIEGGAATVSSFIEAGMVDSLHVLVAPMLIGSGKPGLSMTPIAKLSSALRPPATVHVLDDGDVLFCCDLAKQKPGA